MSKLSERLRKHADLFFPGALHSDLLEAAAALSAPEGMPEEPRVIQIWRDDPKTFDRSYREALAYIDALRAHALRRDASVCPYIVTSNEGTSYCRLAEDTARKGRG